jgi:predicted nucleotidyltransferase
MNLKVPSKNPVSPQPCVSPVLVTFAPESRWSLFDLVGMEHELEKIVDRDVDLVMRKSIEQSHNWIRRKEILGTAKVIYVSG